jgi:hypothetical protein
MSVDPEASAANDGVETRLSHRDVLAWWRAAMSATDPSSVADLVDLGRTLRAADPQRSIGADVEPGRLDR